MERAILAGLSALAIAASSQSFAQSVSATIDLAPEQRTRIKEYVVREKVPAYQYRERLSVGSRLPADVELRIVPSDWGPSVSRYSYIYNDDRVRFVDPDSRTVIYDVE